VLIDLSDTSAATLHDHWLAPAIEAMHRRRLAELQLDCMDGVRFRIAAAQHWRFWRKPQPFAARAGKEQ